MQCTIMTGWDRKVFKRCVSVDWELGRDIK